MSDSFADLVDAFEERRRREQAERDALLAENQGLQGSLAEANETLGELLAQNQRLREKAQAVIDSFATTGFVSENAPSLLALIALREALAGGDT